MGPYVVLVKGEHPRCYGPFDTRDEAQAMGELLVTWKWSVVALLPPVAC